MGWREFNMRDFGEGEVHETKHLPYKIFSASQKELMSPWSDLDARIGIMKSVPENNYLKTCPTSFSGAQSVSFSTLNSLRGTLKINSRSSTDSILTEADGKCPWQAPFCLWHNSKRKKKPYVWKYFRLYKSQHFNSRFCT